MGGYRGVYGGVWGGIRGERGGVWGVGGDGGVWGYSTVPNVF